jgi:hypothetical protein
VLVHEGDAPLIGRNGKGETDKGNTSWSWASAPLLPLHPLSATREQSEIMNAGHHTQEDTDKVYDVDVDVEVGEATLTTFEVDPLEVDETYLTSSKFTRFFRGVLCQMILLGW